MRQRVETPENMHSIQGPPHKTKIVELLMPFIDAKPISKNAFHRARLSGMVCAIAEAAFDLVYIEEGQIFVPEFIGNDFMECSAVAYDIVVLTGCHVMFKFNGMRVKVTPEGKVA